jgi:nucleoside-diphosphate-sugar epimerase
MAPTKIAVAGATGNIGLPIVEALLAANFEVLALSRKGSKNVSVLPKSPKLTIKEVDYSSESELKQVLEGVQSVVSTLATASLEDQKPLIDAAFAAGVERFIPSEYGCDTTNPVTAKLPVFKYKVMMHDVLKAHAASNPRFSYSLLMTGPFFDWGLNHGFFLAPKNHSATLWNGGDVPFSTATVKDIAQAVVGIISHQAETKNRAVYVQSTITTQNKLITYAKEKDGKEWDTTVKSTQEGYDDSMKLLQSGSDIGKAMVGFILYGIFSSHKTGANWDDKHDNELLGVTQLTEQQVKEVVQSFV